MRMHNPIDGDIDPRSQLKHWLSLWRYIIDGAGATKKIIERKNVVQGKKVLPLGDECYGMSVKIW